MFKLVFYICIFIIISYIGFMYAETFRKRENQLKEILKALIILKNDVIEGAMPITEAFDNLYVKLDNPLKNFVIKVKDKLILGNVDSVYEAIEKEYVNVKNDFNLEASDIKIMKDFFKSLGESCIHGQQSLFNMIIEQIKINLEEAHEISKKSIKLYRYLGVCIGAMLVIFLIQPHEIYIQMGENYMHDFTILFKIGGAGILLVVLDKVLTSSGKGEIAAITNIAGIVIILLMIVSIIGDLFNTVKTMFVMQVRLMLIIKVVSLAFVALFISLYLRHSKSELNPLLLLAAGSLILIMMIDPLSEIISFVREVADKANIDTVYIGIVLKILAIAYIASFSSALCKDANADSLAAQIDFSAKIIILLLALPILMAVLNSILQIMQVFL
eukprot:TRINITY_DN11134_c0_g1_i1.p1 TRINITY_DN11134_c0_g1~~TRINITY_DN11134_c0_g1_i1.p1  ORF type:complete len:386 (-),score=33.81 TRINITY_DN11134_c0_g1_i1:206-1363(-)